MVIGGKEGVQKTGLTNVSAFGKMLGLKEFFNDVS